MLKKYKIIGLVFSMALFTIDSYSMLGGQGDATEEEKFELVTVPTEDSPVIIPSQLVDFLNQVKDQILWEIELSQNAVSPVNPQELRNRCVARIADGLRIKDAQEKQALETQVQVIYDSVVADKRLSAVRIAKEALGAAFSSLATGGASFAFSVAKGSLTGV